MTHEGIPGRRVATFVRKVLAYAVPIHLLLLVVGFVVYVGGIVDSDRTPADVAAAWSEPSAASREGAFGAIVSAVDALPNGDAFALVAIMLIAALPAVTISLVAVFDLFGKRYLTAILAAIQVAVMIVAMSGVIGG